MKIERVSLENKGEIPPKATEKRFSLPDLKEAEERKYPWVESAKETQNFLIEQIEETEENLEQLEKEVKEGTDLHKRLEELAYHYYETRLGENKPGTPEEDFKAAIRDFKNWYNAKKSLLNEKWKRLEILSSEEKGKEDKELNLKAYLIAEKKEKEGLSPNPIECNNEARKSLLKELGKEITDKEVGEFMKKEEEIERRMAERVAVAEKERKETETPPPPEEEKKPEELKKPEGSKEEIERQREEKEVERQKEEKIAKLEKEITFLWEEYCGAKSNINKFKGKERQIKEENLKLIKDKYCAKKKELIRKKIELFTKENPEMDINKNPEKFLEEILNQMGKIEDQERKTLLPVQEKERWEKFKDWWRRHPIARMLIGAGLTIATIGSIYTGQLYLTPALIGARMGMAGVSTAIATEAALERWNNYLKKGITGKLLKLTKRGDSDKIKEITEGLTIGEIIKQISKISVIQRKEKYSIGPYTAIIDTLKQRERELLIDAIIKEKEEKGREIDLADALSNYLTKQQETMELTTKLALDTQRKNEIRNRVYAITAGATMAALVGHLGFTRLAEETQLPPKESLLPKIPEISERGLKANFSLELGKEGIPPHLERVFLTIAVDHMKLDPDKIFGVEQGAIGLNVAANLVELAEGNNVAGINAEEVKEIFTWDPKEKVLEIKKYPEFNKLVGGLIENGKENWDEGVLQSPGGAAGFLGNIETGTWEDIIEAKGLKQIIEGHEITPDKITDFEKDPMVQAAKELPIGSVPEVEGEVEKEPEVEGKPEAEGEPEAEGDEKYVQAEEVTPAPEVPPETQQPPVEATIVELTPTEEWLNKALLEQGTEGTLPEVLRQIKTGELTAKEFFKYYEKMMNIKYDKDLLSNLEANFSIIKNEGEYSKENVELTKRAIKILLMKIESKI